MSNFFSKMSKHNLVQLFVLAVIELVIALTGWGACRAFGIAGPGPGMGFVYMLTVVGMAITIAVYADVTHWDPWFQD